MKARDISDALNYLDDDLIAEAAAFDARGKKKAKVTMIRIGAFAAAAAALVLGYVLISTLGSSSSSRSETGTKAPAIDANYAAGTVAEIMAEDADGDDRAYSYYSSDVLAGGDREFDIAFETTGYALEGGEENADDAPEGPESYFVIEDYEFSFNDILYVTSFEEADPDRVGDLLGQSGTDEDIYADLEDEDGVIIELGGALYYASEKEE